MVVNQGDRPRLDEERWLGDVAPESVVFHQERLGTYENGISLHAIPLTVSEGNRLDFAGYVDGLSVDIHKDCIVENETVCRHVLGEGFSLQRLAECHIVEQDMFSVECFQIHGLYDQLFYVLKCGITKQAFQSSGLAYLDVFHRIDVQVG